MKELNRLWSIYFFILWGLIALFAPIIANDTNSSFALVPYSANTIDYENANFVSPFDNQNIKSTYFKHWLGTDNLGRDVLAQLIHGSKNAFLIGFGAMFLAGIVGIMLGAIAAYFGDSTLQLRRSSAYVLLFYLTASAILCFVIVPWEINTVPLLNNMLASLSIMIVLGILSIGLNSWLQRRQSSQSIIFLPLDLIIGRFIEVLESIPLLFLLIALSALLTPSRTSTIIIIAIVAWPTIAKFTRAEVLKVKNLGYVENSKALGLSNFQIIRQHILPNALGPVLISLSFGLAAAILMESTLSFLGIGIGSSEASWGDLLASARKDYSAWWLAVFPGVLIFLTVLASNHIHRTLSKR